MSYILEALQKSQKNRGDTKVPTLDAVLDQDVVTEDSRSNNRLPATLLLGGLLVVFSGIAWWLTTGDESVVVHNTEFEALTENTNEIGASHIQSYEVIEPTEQALASAEKVDDSINGNAAEAILAGASAAVPDVKADTNQEGGLLEEIIFDNSSIDSGEAFVSSSEVEMAQIDDQSLDKVYKSTEPEGKQINSQQVVKPVDSVREDVIEGISIPTAASQRGKAENLAAPESSGEELEELMIDAAEETPGGLDETKREVQHFRELPYDVQRDLPTISYSVHLYSPASESRMVKIDGMMRREGDAVSPGLVLQEITPDGAIFTFRGHEFRVPVHG